jgi:hypothetical protein
MNDPCAPPSSTELETESGEPLISRHWFWKVYAVGFAVYALQRTFLFLGARGVPAKLLVHQLILALASVGVLAYAFSKRILWRWVWHQLWWIFPVSELVAYLTAVAEAAALERTFAAFRGVHVAAGLPTSILFVPLSSLAVYRLGRGRIWR